MVVVKLLAVVCFVFSSMAWETDNGTKSERVKVRGFLGRRLVLGFECFGVLILLNID
jgi:hypothetical protein